MTTPAMMHVDGADILHAMRTMFQANGITITDEERRYDVCSKPFWVFQVSKMDDVLREKTVDAFNVAFRSCGALIVTDGHGGTNCILLLPCPVEPNE